MPNLRSELILALVDNVSKPALAVEKALQKATAQVKAIEGAMAGTGLSSRFQNQLATLGTSAANVEKVSLAFKEYAKSAGLASNATSWTKTQQAQVRSWEASTI